MKKRSLYDINDDLFTLVEDINELDQGEEDRRQELIDQLNSYQLEFHDKMSQWVKMDLYQDSLINSVKDEIKRLTGLNRRLETNKESFRDRALHLMQGHGLKRAGKAGHQYRVSTSHRVVVVDINKVDREYIRTKTTEDVNRKEIKAYIKDTGEIPTGVDYTTHQGVTVVR